MKKKILIIAFGVILLTGVFLFAFSYNSKLVLEINGDSEITLAVNSTYGELGYKATCDDKEASDLVEVKNDVDTSKLGRYVVEYIMKKRNKIIKKERIVNIVDTEAPVITLKESNDMQIYVNSKFEDPGYEVKDNYDDNPNVSVTGNVDTSKVGKYELVYKARDNSNNESIVKRSVSVNQKTITGTKLPVLMYHFFYDASKGQTAGDNNFTEVSSFDQQVKYLVDNNYYFPTWDEISDYLDGKILLPTKSIVLTFDDGSPTFFDLAYPVLKKYNVKGTSFIVTSWVSPDSKYDLNVLSYQSHSHNMHRGGCKGGHGGIFQCLPETQAIDDLQKSKQISNNATVFCYPFGDVTPGEIALVKKAGYKMAFTTKSGKISPKMDKYQLPRVRISGGLSLQGFIKAIS